MLHFCNYFMMNYVWLFLLLILSYTNPLLLLSFVSHFGTLLIVVLSCCRTDEALCQAVPVHSEPEVLDVEPLLTLLGWCFLLHLFSSTFFTVKINQSSSLCCQRSCRCSRCPVGGALQAAGLSFWCDTSATLWQDSAAVTHQSSPE